jgi:hypothetical protein
LSITYLRFYGVRLILQDVRFDLLNRDIFLDLVNFLFRVPVPAAPDPAENDGEQDQQAADDRDDRVGKTQSREIGEP